MVTQEEFQEFLSEHYAWERNYTDASLNFYGEIVYTIDSDKPDDPHEIHQIENRDLELRVFSSIDKRTGEGRPKGQDAIRTTIWSLEWDRPIGGRTRTHRIKTWRNNLKKKIDSLLHDWRGEVTRCGECGNWMVVREGRYGEFLGCLGYPECDNTKEIEG